jgi:3-oxoacyl-[acyl-carrier protein] reductase
MSKFKVAVITGSSSGIGLGLVKKFVADGYIVHSCSRRDSGFQHPNHKHAAIDLGDREKVEEWIKAVVNENSTIDVLVCNAAQTLVRAALLTTREEFERIFDVNFFSAVQIASQISRTMLAGRKGSIIFLSSSAVSVKDIATSAYASSKAALELYCQILAKEIAPFGLRANVLRVPIFESSLTEGLSKTTVDRILERVPARRFADIDDIYYAINFLIREQASIFNGNILRVGEVG